VLILLQFCQQQINAASACPHITRHPVCSRMFICYAFNEHAFNEHAANRLECPCHTITAVKPSQNNICANIPALKQACVNKYVTNWMRKFNGDGPGSDCDDRAPEYYQDCINAFVLDQQVDECSSQSIIGCSCYSVPPESRQKCLDDYILGLQGKQHVSGADITNMYSVMKPFKPICSWRYQLCMLAP
jgi:hypothetical protein